MHFSSCPPKPLTIPDAFRFVHTIYPIVVANCYPYDIDLWQSIKGIWAGDLITANGGTLIAFTAAPEGNSTYPLVPGYVGRDADEVKREIEAGAALDDKQAATGVMFRTLMRRIRLVLVSDGLTAEDARTMGIDYYRSVEAAVAAEIDRLPNRGVDRRERHRAAGRRCAAGDRAGESIAKARRSDYALETQAGR